VPTLRRLLLLVDRTFGASSMSLIISQQLQMEIHRQDSLIDMELHADDPHLQDMLAASLDEVAGRLLRLWDRMVT
jgi:hypothetical protein